MGLTNWLPWLRQQPLTLGQRGERLAARWLRKQGYIIVAGGRRSRYGEIDIVAVEGETIVFVEVKTRQSHDKGHPAEAVDGRKQEHIARSALAYLREHHLLEYRARFDVIAITWPAKAKRPQLQHFKNAFEPSDCGQFFS